MFNVIVTIGIGIIITLIGAVYLNMKDEIKATRDEAKDLRAAQFQTSRDITDLRVLTTRIGSQIDQVIQRLPQTPAK